MKLTFFIFSPSCCSNSESVRDLQFNPHNPVHFCAVSESGNVQLWDMRRPDRVEKQFTAHGGPIFALDWHPEVKTWIATAGRDKTIKVRVRKGRIKVQYKRK